MMLGVGPQPDHAEGTAARSTSRLLRSQIGVLYTVGVVLSYGTAAIASMVTRDPGTYHVADLSLALIALLLMPWRPQLGAVLGISAVLLSIYLREPPGDATLLIVIALLLTFRKSRWRWALIAAGVAVGVAETILHRPSANVVILLIYYVLAASAGVAIGMLFRHVFRTIRAAEHHVEQIDQRPQEIRRDERDALADELVESLHADLAENTLSTRSSAQSVHPRVALQTAIEDARGSLRRLRTLISTLRGRESATHVPATMSDAVEAAEETLVGNGFLVAIPLGAFPPVTPKHAALVHAFLSDAADHFAMHGTAGTEIRIEITADKHDLRATMSGIVPATRTPSAGVRTLKEKLTLIGGALLNEHDGKRLVLTAVIPTDAAANTERAESSDRVWKVVQGAARHHRWLLTAWFLFLSYPLFLPSEASGIADLHTSQAGLVVLAVLIAAVWMRRAGIILAIVTALALSFSGFGLAADEWLILSAAVYVLVTHRGKLLAFSLGGIALYSLVRCLSQPHPLEATLNLLSGAMLVSAIAIVILVIASYLEAKNARLRHLSALQHEIRQLERASLAGELHDVLAYHLTMIVMEAEQHLDSSVEEQHRALLSIAKHKEAALVDMSVLTEFLRDEDRATKPTDDQTMQVHDVAAGLCKAMEQQGFTHHCFVDGATTKLERTIRHTVNRILREGVTNALRYAQPGSTITMAVTVGADLSTMVRVVSMLNTVQMRDRSGLSTGTGLEALKARVELLDGEFSAQGGGGHWVVHASLPGTLSKEPTE